MRDFYVVWNDGGRVPVVKHDEFDQAKREAERLTRLHGGMFHVLRRVATCERTDITWQVSDVEVLEECPF